MNGSLNMLYAILCYHDEDFVGSWSKSRLRGHEKLAVVQRSSPSKPARPVARCCDDGGTLAQDDPPLVIDGPMRKPRSNCSALPGRLPDLDDALDVARDLGAPIPAAPMSRPVGMFAPGARAVTDTPGSTR